jgi:Kef-type K+ transport system membrane component KefB/nucleotide-binding universal stress UspA family protein
MEALRAIVADNPLVAFTILLLVSLTLPPLFERIRLPGLVGLLLAGVLLGPSVLGFLHPDGDIEKLFADVGKVYLMFVAALEIDFKEFSRNRDRSIVFGVLTFTVPILGGILLGRLTGFGWNASVLIGSLLASHTLLTYPIVMRFGVARNEAVTAAVGATIITDISALMVLAICVAIHQGDFSAFDLTRQLLSLGIYAAVVLFGLDWVGKIYFRRTGNDQGNQFLFILLAVFLASVGAQLIQVEMIIGAFLAGLAVNDVVGEGPVKEKVEFVGGVLFIPFFFVCMGSLLDIPVYVEALTQRIGITLGIVLTLVITKLIAATVAGKIFKYSRHQILTMWSLSLPQVAVTLAAALVGLQVGIINPPVFNAVIVMMLITSLLSSITTTAYARNLPIPPVPSGWSEGDRSETWLKCDLPGAFPFVAVVPVSNPLTQRYLIEMAALIAGHEGGYIVPLAIAPAQAHMDDPKLLTALTLNQKLLETAEEISRQWGTEAKSQIRIADDIATGICRSAREQNAQLIVMGWSPTESIRARLFGTLIDAVFWAAHCPVAVTRLQVAPIDMHRILIPVKTLTPEAVRAIRFGQVFADTHQASLILLHASDRRTPPEQLDALHTSLTNVMQEGPAVDFSFKFVTHDNPSDVILDVSREVDLVILRSVRRRTAGGLAVSDVTEQVLQGLTCSVVIFGEPHS